MLISDKIVLKILNSHIPHIKSISEFFQVYGIGQPFDAEIMCKQILEAAVKYASFIPK